MSELESGGPGVREAIAAELLHIHDETYAKGARSAQTLIGDDTIVVLLDELELQRNEEFLISAGEGRAVLELRQRYQQAIETTFRSAVERATGRRVISFASITKVNPNYVVEIFRLSPAADDATATDADTSRTRRSRRPGRRPWPRSPATTIRPAAPGPRPATARPGPGAPRRAVPRVG